MVAKACIPAVFINESIDTPNKKPMISNAHTGVSKGSSSIKSGYT